MLNDLKSWSIESTWVNHHLLLGSIHHESLEPCNNLKYLKKISINNYICFVIIKTLKPGDCTLGPTISPFLMMTKHMSYLTNKWEKGAWRLPLKSCYIHEWLYTWMDCMRKKSSRKIIAQNNKLTFSPPFVMHQKGLKKK